MRHEWLRDRLQALEAEGKSQKGLAEALGVSPPTIVAIIKGDREIKVRELRIVADYLKMDLADVASRFERRQELRTDQNYASGELTMDDAQIIDRSPTRLPELPASIDPEVRRLLLWVAETLAEGPSSYGMALDGAIDLTSRLKAVR